MTQEREDPPGEMVPLRCHAGKALSNGFAIYDKSDPEETYIISPVTVYLDQEDTLCWRRW